MVRPISPCSRSFSTYRGHRWTTEDFFGLFRARLHLPPVARSIPSRWTTEWMGIAAYVLGCVPPPGRPKSRNIPI